MAANSVKALKEDFLNCSICKNRFNVPKILPCIHSFCQGCLEKYVQRLNCNQLPCPICRKSCDLTDTGVKGLQTNFHLVNLGERMDLMERLNSNEAKSYTYDSCESTDVSAFCSECDSTICLKCQNDHKRFPALRSHSIIPINAIKRPKYQRVLKNARAPSCDIHPTEKLRFYCTTCSKLICRDCTIVQHPKPGHDCVEVSSQLDEVKRVLSALLVESTSYLQNNLEFIKSGKAGSKTVARESKTLIQDMHISHDRMMAAIQKQFKIQMDKMCKEVTQSKTSQINKIDEKVSKASTWMTRMENTQGVTEKVIHENNMWEILAMSHDLISAFDALKIDANEFSWSPTDLNQTIVFKSHEVSPVTFGKCYRPCDVVVSDRYGNFVMCTFDRGSCELFLTKLRKDKSYSLKNADYISPYKVGVTIPKNAQITAASATRENSIFIGLGRWITQFNYSSNSYGKLLETSKNKTVSITFLAFSEVYNVLYLNHSNEKYLKQFRYNQVNPMHMGQDDQHQPNVNVEAYLSRTEHKMLDHDSRQIENIFCYNNVLIYSSKESPLSKNSVYIWSKEKITSLTITFGDSIHNRNLLSVLKGSDEGSDKGSMFRHSSNAMFTCLILWGKPSLPPFTLLPTFIITEYNSSSQKIIRTWNVPEECAQPAACYKDNRTNQLMVCDLYGKVTNC